MFDIFLIFAQNKECEYPHSMFWSNNNKKKKRGLPCKPQFYYIKVGYMGVFITRKCFPDISSYRQYLKKQQYWSDDAMADIEPCLN